MLGIGLEENFAELNFQDSIWLHSVSVGEVVAAKPIFDLLKINFPDKQIGVSTITETGQNMAKMRLKDADAIFYFPVDVTPVIRKFVKVFKPKIFITMETELWPNFLRIMHEEGVKTFIVNGKLSPSSFNNYKRFNFLFKESINNMTGFCMQNEESAQRAIDLGIDPQKVYITGNCKFDMPPVLLNEEEKNQILNRIKISSDRKIIVAGSTHNGEEKIIIDSFLELREKFNNLTLILAPRHPERFDEVYSYIKNTGLKISRNSNIKEENPDVLLLDTIGDLAKFYGLGVISIVGGSFADIGGHNLLEAAVHGIPVVYGPNMHKQPDIKSIINEGNGGIKTTANNLYEVLNNLLEDESERTKIGIAAKNAAVKNQGSAKKSIEIIKSLI